MSKNGMSVCCICLLLASLSGLGFAASDNSSLACPPNTLYSPIHGFCALISDQRESYKVQGTASMQGKLPDLVALRKRKALERGLKADGMPIPGGLGAGIQYSTGSLQVLDHAELSTVMYVYPDGVKPSGPLS